MYDNNKIKIAGFLNITVKFTHTYIIQVNVECSKKSSELRTTSEL